MTVRAVYGAPPMPGRGRDDFEEHARKMIDQEPRLTDEALIATEQHCIAMLRYLRLAPHVRAIVDRHIGAAMILVGEDRRGMMASERAYEQAQRLAEGLRSHPSRDLHKESK